ncbi:MAG: hypothetical protein JOZ97_08410 [Candidatus Eremiobacteraeota bacterium]|nr:hypothetical protein [Candidatus Eremiobacteraeota bacterium]
MFHVEPLGETTAASLAEFDRGLLIGVLISSAHFGGDGRQPQITLKLHVRHERLLRYLLTTIPSARLYGPYFHGGRQYFQLMFRGEALRRDLIPLLDALPWQRIDSYSYERYCAMKERYAIQ